MKIFHCDHCQSLVFFENVTCVNCRRPLAYLPDLADMGSLEQAGDTVWRSPAPGANGRVYRLCQHYRHDNAADNVCNWVVTADDPSPLCRSCRLTRVIPDLKQPGNPEAWYQLEVAKRRLIYTLIGLDLPLATKTEDPEHGLAFEFLADPPTPASGPVLTGHKDGVITLNVAEADDAERERRRLQMREPYRTLLGHFRHEIGHYYWYRLLKDSARLDGFRALFGDERADYGAALKRHHESGAPPDWQQRFVSAYASAHPWEDWAETWAHYLHIIDTLETATGCGLSLWPRRADEPALKQSLTWHGCRPEPFDRMMESWMSLTYVLNNLNRSLGLGDAYPFVLPDPATAKLRFVHEVAGSKGE